MRVDGVFSGGGLKGLALVGAYEELERQGLTFQRIAGTSAGSILAAFIAAGFTAKEIADLLAEQDFSELLDRRASLVPTRFMKWLNLYWRMGLYQGKALEDWFTEKLLEKQVYTFGDLPPGKLKLVASDLTNGKMLVLPDDLEKYGIPADTFPVARALRMSCGIPYFFEPVRLFTSGGEAIVVDGGVLSNFPMWIFDDEKGKRERPVIGLKLSRSQEERRPHEIRNALDLFEALFSTMKNAHDERYISREHARDVVFIPMDDVKATDFDMDLEQMEKLMERGRDRTRLFLKTWRHTSTPGRGSVRVV
ncbi:patatin-like phospholipase family protein [Bhargavaea ginsengi]|uniref:patatin-like phospholipase family protein n=1 Tax=Bhargavaea ginsengi TaxID=426757 RepID=UPI002041F762|nr:patatin-like phospholipase family protein [Bhargavaea ginsengi]MCM3086982.1 patatin-like phospholipase family protein [Bhargavaea ginsengi]